MKNRFWALILCGLVALCLAAALLLRADVPAQRAVITSGGAVVATVDLYRDQELVIPTRDGGSNTVTVRDGKIAVTAATCPDHHCMNRGFCDGGTPIVCLPNKLVITFEGAGDVDGAVG